MNPLTLEQTLQIVAWTIALWEFIVAGYTLALNSRQSINRNLSGFLLLLGINSLALGAMQGAETISEARTPAVLLAITAPMIQPILLSASIRLFRQNWQRSRLSWLVSVGYLLASIPLIATLFDLATKQGIWLSRLEAAGYQSGYLPLIAYAQGSLADIIWLTCVWGAAALVLLSLLYLILFDNQVFPSARRLGWLLLIAQIVGIGLNAGLAERLYPLLPQLFTNLLLASAFSYASFRQMVSERHLQRGPLQVRLTILTLIVTIPVLGSALVFLTSQAAQRLEQDALQRLEQDNRHLAASVNLWLESELRTYQSILENLNNQPGEQAAVLQELVTTHPELSQAAIVDHDGSVIASAGGKSLTSLAKEAWLTQVQGGAEYIAQVWDHPNFTLPVFFIALPMPGSANNPAGTGVFFYSLNSLSEKLLPETAFPSGQVYVFDETNHILLTNNPALFPPGADVSLLETVADARSGYLGAIRFPSQSGEQYRASASMTPQGWGVVVQQSEATLLAPGQLLRRATWLLITVSILIIALLVWLTIRHALHPIASLTTIANKITSGDLSRTVPVESEDELGNLARSMNNMIAQMRGLITNLEQRVSERTQEVERRAIQLQVTAEVASESASIRELERLLDHTVRLISERFGFYHSGIFLIDDQGEYAVLRAASSEGGQRMLARRHKLRVGQTGIVGYVAEKGESRIALDVGQEPVYFNNPDLPQTRSEAALPLRVRGRVIGVLDVQSPQPEAFKPEDIQTLEALADQIALAIDNARLFDENRQALSELQSLYSTQLRKGWQSRLEDRSITYVYDRLAVQPANNLEHTVDFGNPTDPYVITAPLELRGWQLGSLSLKREPNQAPWSQQERALLQETARQIALALDNARLLETVQRNAYHEQVIGQIAAKAQSSLVLENVMKTAVQEIGQAIQASRVQIRLHTGNGEHPSDEIEELQHHSSGGIRNE